MLLFVDILSIISIVRGLYGDFLWVVVRYI